MKYFFPFFKPLNTRQFVGKCIDIAVFGQHCGISEQYVFKLKGTCNRERGSLHKRLYNVSCSCNAEVAEVPLGMRGLFVCTVASTNSHVTYVDDMVQGALFGTVVHS